MAPMEGRFDGAEIIRMCPWPVEMFDGEGTVDRISIFQMNGIAYEAALISERADTACNLARKFVGYANMVGPDNAKIADIGVKWAFSVVDPACELRNEKIDVGVALAVCVGGFIDGHVVNEAREVCSVIQIEAAKKILVGFAFAGMDGYDETRHGLQQLPDAINRPKREFFGGDGALAGCKSAADRIGMRGDDLDLFGR